MKKNCCRRVFFLFLLVSFIWSQCVIGMLSAPYMFDYFKMKDDNTLSKHVGVGAVEYKKTKTGKDKVVAIVILDGSEEVSNPVNSYANARYAEHRKVLLDLARQEDIRYAYLSPKIRLTPTVLGFYEFSRLKKLNESEEAWGTSPINFKDWCNEEDDAMRIVLIFKYSYDDIHNTLLALKFERQREIPICETTVITSEKTIEKTDPLKVCFTLTVLPVTPFQLKEFLLNLHECCGMCAKKIKSQDDKIRSYCSNKCLKAAEKEKEAYNKERGYCLIQ